MAYNKEYYEKNKEILKKRQREWRNAHKEEVNRKAREKRASLSEEEKEEINRKAREKRQAEGDLARQRYRENYYKNAKKINERRKAKRLEISNNTNNK